MLVRIEAFGRVLHIEYGKESNTDSTEDAGDTDPMRIETPEFVGFVAASQRAEGE